MKYKLPSGTYIETKNIEAIGQVRQAGISIYMFNIYMSSGTTFKVDSDSKSEVEVHRDSLLKAWGVDPATHLVWLS